MTTIQKNSSVQEVFANAENHWQSFAYDKNGRAYLHDRPVSDMICHREGWTNKNKEGHWLYVGNVEDASDWQDSAVSREKSSIVRFDKLKNWCDDQINLYKRTQDGPFVNLFENKSIEKDLELSNAKKEILALKALVNVQDEQLKEFEAKEDVYSEVLSETLQTLYAADPEARVSLTAGQLLQLTEQSNEDDLPFS